MRNASTVSPNGITASSGANGASRQTAIVGRASASTVGRNQRPSLGEDTRYRDDPNFKPLVLFHEYFHGDTGRGLGASHQTGWTALAGNLLERVADVRARDKR